MRLRRSEKPQSSKKGRPKYVPLEAQPKNPENYPTILEYLESKGAVQYITKYQMVKARHKYIRGMNPQKIADELGLEVSVIHRWALIFSWDEEKDRRVFQLFRKLNPMGKIYGKNISERHDRIAGTIEQVAESLLRKHQDNEVVLAVRDLATLASTLKATQDIRKNARGEASVGSVDKKIVDVNYNFPSSIEKVAEALVDAHNKPKAIPSKVLKSISVEVGKSIGTDSEYETPNE